MEINGRSTTVVANVYDSSNNENLVTAASGGGILLFGYLFEIASRFVFGIIVARTIGASGYGLSVLGVTLAMALATVARLGLAEGIVHFLPKALHERDEDRAWGLLQVGLLVPSFFGLAIGILLFALARFVAVNLFHDAAITPILRWVSICIPLIAGGDILMAATRGFKRMQYHVFAERIVLNLGKIILTLVFLKLGFGVTGVIAAYAIMWIVVVGLMFYFLNQLFSLKRPVLASRYNFRELISFSAPVCLTKLISQFDGSFELLLLGVMGSLAYVGIYSGALRIQLVGVMFLVAIEMASKPIISHLYHRNDSIQLGRLYQTLTRWCVAFILPYFFTVSLFAMPILAIFGEEFKVGATPLIILSIGMLINAGTGICGAVLTMTGHTRIEFFNIAAAVILNSALNLLLIPVLGMVGAAVGTSLAIGIVNIARLIQIRRLLKLWPYDHSFIKPFVASVIAVSVTFMTMRLFPAGVNLFYLILNVCILWISCAAVTLLLGLSSEDQMLLSNLRRRLNVVLHRQ